MSVVSFASWFYTVLPRESVALTALVVSLVAATGLALGSIKVRGISLGIPGVMFTGLLFARLLGPHDPAAPVLNEKVIFFIRDFGLILFVYAVGVQVGPGFLASLRKRGLPLNLMAMSIVLLGALLCIAISFATRFDIKAAVGLFAGATTNAPALGSATEAIKSLVGPDRLNDAMGLMIPGFAIAYPFGLVGVIVAMVALRVMFKVRPQHEAEVIEALEKSQTPSVATLNIELKNPNFNGVELSRIPVLKHTHIVISRILQKGGDMIVASPETTVSVGDVLLAVGPAEELGDLQMTIGEKAKVDLTTVPSHIVTRQVIVTHREVLGQTVEELDLPGQFGVTITRIARTGLEFTAVSHLRLQFGDRVRMVGEPKALDAAEKALGNSMRELNLPRLLPIFLGIALGVFIGSIPFYFPGLPAPVKLGLASGPMIVAIILARIGRVGPLIWYMPHAASTLLKEFGIVLFLIAVGLLAGEGFFKTLFTPVGLHLLLLGAAVTLVPLLIVGLIAKVVFKVNYLHVCGLLAGSMTSPSLSFTSTMTSSEAPAVAFATVYPLTMILRVLVAQLMVLVFR